MKGKMKISTMVMSRFIGFTALSLILCLLVVGCSIQKRVYVQESVIIDYSKYNNKGFFITESNSVNFEYKAIGSISAKVESGYGTVDSYKEKTMNDDLYPQEMSVKVKYRDYIQATPEAALETLYKKAIENGANGVINLKITPIINNENPYISIITGYFVTGMAINKD